MKIQTNLSNRKGNYATITISPEQVSGKTIRKNAQFWLYVLGTEKHESRRIDNQLRGRSGRQGDPWVSQFYVALDDEIMRKMWGDTIKSIAKRLLPKEELENMELTQSQFTSSIVRAQKQMEWYNFGIRKHLFEYDNVVNKQRMNIYSKRDWVLNLLFDKDFELIDSEIRSFISVITTHHFDKLSSMEWYETELFETLNQIFWLDRKEEDFLGLRQRQLVKDVISRLEQMYDHKISSYENKQVLFDFMKSVYLDVIDNYRVDHIDEMQYLRDKVWLYGYAQQDPLVLYKQEWYTKFLQLWIDIKSDILSNIYKADLNLLVNRYIPTSQVDLDMAYDNKEDFDDTIQDLYQIGKDILSQAASPYPQDHIDTSDVQVIDLSSQPSSTPMFIDKKIWPNEPCPCGSGKKYKKCHGVV